MNDEHELSGLYALDALDGEDRTRFEAHLATCAACRTEVAEFRETMAIVGPVMLDDRTSGADGAPPASLRARVLDGLDDADRADLTDRTSAAPSGTVVALRRRTRRTAPSRLTVGLLAAAAVVVLVLGATAVVRSRDRGPVDAASLLGELRARGAVTFPVQGTAVAAAGQLVVDAPGGRAVLVLDGLAAVDPDHTYQAWTIDTDQHVHVAPVFRPDASGHALVALTSLPAGITTVAVTVEPRRGSTLPTTPVVLQAVLA